jgi:hypothetical protein
VHPDGLIDDGRIQGEACNRITLCLLSLSLPTLFSCITSSMTLELSCDLVEAIWNGIAQRIASINGQMDSSNRFWRDSALEFVTSISTKNYSQVDRLWRIIL